MHPVDVGVVGRVPVISGAVIRCRPVGALVMEDEAGGDEKIVAVPVSRLTRRYDRVIDYTDLPDIVLAEPVFVDNRMIGWAVNLALDWLPLRSAWGSASLSGT